MTHSEIVSNYFAAWNSHSVEAILSTFAEGGVYVDPTVPAGVSGEGLSAMVEGYLNAFPDLVFQVVNIIDAGGDVIAAEWSIRATHSGALGPFSPTWKTVSLRGVDVFHVRDGKFQTVEGYYDSAAMQLQLGA